MPLFTKAAVHARLPILVIHLLPDLFKPFLSAYYQLGTARKRRLIEPQLRITTTKMIIPGTGGIGLGFYGALPQAVGPFAGGVRIDMTGYRTIFPAATLFMVIGFIIFSSVRIPVKGNFSISQGN